MKYTFEHQGKQKTVEIDDEWIYNQKTNLDISTKEAIELWMFDHDYAENETVNELTAKAKVAGTNVRGQGKQRKAPTRKPDEVKRELIQHIYKSIQEYAGVREPQVTNIERIIAFSLGEDNYEITLSKKRKPKV